MTGKYTIPVFVISVIVIPVAVFGIMTWYSKTFSPLPVFPQQEKAVFQLQNQSGNMITSEHWKGKIAVVDFFFTHCPVICPKMTRNMKRVEAAFNDGSVVINSFTVDPERDHVKQLNSYARRYQIGKNWHLMTGDKIEIYRMARKSFAIVATDGDGGPKDFIHSEQFVLLDTEQKIRGYYNGTSETEVNQLINDIKKLKNED